MLWVSRLIFSYKDIFMKDTFSLPAGSARKSMVRRQKSRRRQAYNAHIAAP